MKLNAPPLFLSLFCAAVLLLAACKGSSQGSQTSDQTDPVIAQLAQEYANGEFSSCTLENRQVFSGRKNVYDGETVIYEKNGTILLRCNYAWGRPDHRCGELSNCKVIYRVAKNIWGLEGVNLPEQYR